MKTLITTLLLFWLLAVNGQTNYKDSLNYQLNTILENDQYLRKQIDSIGSRYGYQSEELKNLWEKINYTDSLNLILVKEILDKYGWLNGKLFTQKAKDALFLVIQHSDLATQVKYIKLLKKATHLDKLLLGDYAYLFDRIEVQKGNFQYYGTQLTRKQDGKYTLFPIHKELSLNKRRLKMGLNKIEEYCNQIKVNYEAPKKDIYRNKRIVLGIIVDSLQNPLKNIIVSAKNQSTIAITDDNGEFKLILNRKTKCLRFEKNKNIIIFELPKEKLVFEFVYVLK